MQRSRMPVTDRAGRALRQSHVSLIFDVRQNHEQTRNQAHARLWLLAALA
jgi:hypothetical protein